MDLSFPDEKLYDQLFPLQGFLVVLIQGVFGFKIRFLEFLIDQRLDVVSGRAEAAFHDELLTFFGMKVVDKEQRGVWMRRSHDDTRIPNIGYNRIDRPPLYRSPFALADEYI